MAIKAAVKVDLSWKVVDDQSYNVKPGESLRDLPGPGFFSPVPDPLPAETWAEGLTGTDLDDALTAYKAAKVVLIDGIETKYRTGIFSGGVDGFRAYEYVISLLEAADVLTISDYPGISGSRRNILAKKASAHGGGATETTEATAVDSTYESFRDIIGDTAGIRVKHKDAITAATDRAGVDAAVAAYVAEMDAYIAAL